MKIQGNKQSLVWTSKTTYKSTKLIMLEEIYTIIIM